MQNAGVDRSDSEIFTKIKNLKDKYRKCRSTQSTPLSTITSPNRTWEYYNSVDEIMKMKHPNVNNGNSNSNNNNNSSNMNNHNNNDISNGGETLRRASIKRKKSEFSDIVEKVVENDKKRMKDSLFVVTEYLNSKLENIEASNEELKMKYEELNNKLTDISMFLDEIRQGLSLFLTQRKTELPF